MFGKPIKTNFKNLKLDRFSVSDINYFITAIKDTSINKLLYYYHNYSQEQGKEWYNKNVNNKNIYIWGVFYDYFK